MVNQNQIKIPKRKSPKFHSIDEFNIVREIGDGAFSTVYEMVHKSTGMVFAVKDMRLTDIHEDDIPNLESELCVHPRMDNEYIVTFVDFIATETNIYLFLEVAENGILFRFIDNGHPIDQCYIKKFFYQTCCALIYMHDMDQIHRDIKPENILLTKNLNIRVADFGWVTISERFKHNKSMCGTPEYMAPEIIKAEKQTKAVDIWSMGILLYEMFHNDDCFSGEDHYQIYSSIQKKQINWKSNCPPDAKDLILKLLEFKPEDRLSLENALYHPYMASYTNSMPNHSVSLDRNKATAALIRTPLARKIINDYTKTMKSNVIGHIEENGKFAPGVKPSKKQLNPPVIHKRNPSRTIMGIKDELKRYESISSNVLESNDEHVKLLRDEEVSALQKTREQFEALTKNIMIQTEEEPVVVQKPTTTIELSKKE